MVSNAVVYEEISDEIWLKYKNNPNIDLRNNIVLNYLYLVKQVVYRMTPGYKNYIEKDDLLSYGVLGLIDAIEKYDISKNVKFVTYASLRIKGSIIDNIRKLDWAPRGLRQRVKKVEECYQRFLLENGREPTENELARALSITEKELNKFMDNSYVYNIVSFDEQISASISEGSLVDLFNESPDSIFEEKELVANLSEGIESLSEKEKQVISLYYYDELTLKEIGKVLGVSESRVCQIHSKSILKLNMYFQKKQKQN